MQYREDRDGNRLSVLGFGCMRLPRKGGGIDLAEAEREIMEAYHAGVNYYDTAYIYSGREKYEETDGFLSGGLSLLQKGDGCRKEA